MNLVQDVGLRIRRSSSITRFFAIFLRDNLMSLGLRKQVTMSKSSTKAEHKALANETTKVTWIQSLLKGLSIFAPLYAKL
jgi:hypothetical protein